MGTVHIATNFYDCVTDLNSAEIKQVNKAIKQIQSDPRNPSLRRHKLERIKAKNVVSYSPNQDIRIIAFEPDDNNTYLLYVDHHDAAYTWAQNRRIDVDLATQVLRMVNVRAEEMILNSDKNSDKPLSAESEGLEALFPKRQPGTAYLYDPCKDNEIVAAGVPQSYLGVVRRVITQHDALLLVKHVPSGVGDALIELASAIVPGYQEDILKPESVANVSTTEVTVPYRSFTTDRELQLWVEELSKALELPFDRWRTFLHPSQRKAVTMYSNGPIRVTGGAGTGKTVVGLHRAQHLCSTQFFRISMLTFNRTLMNNLRGLAKNLFGEAEAGNIKIDTFHGFVLQRLRECGYELPTLTWQANEFLAAGLTAIKPQDLASSWTQDIVSFVQREIVGIIAPQRLDSVIKYIKAPRRGTGKNLSLKQKEELWKIYEVSWRQAKATGRIPGDLLSHYALELNLPRLEKHALIVDEVQDLNPADLVFLAEQAKGSNQLTLLEDAKQRIYGAGYSLKSLGINVVGKRSIKLFVNYRTTAEIAKAANQTLTGIGTNELDFPASLRNGKEPVIKHCKDDTDEFKWVVGQIDLCKKRGLARLAVVARSHGPLDEIEPSLLQAGIRCKKLDRNQESFEDGVVALCTMHSVKGLEFEAVFVISLNYGRSGIKIPQDIKSDETAARDFERREKHLMYVALTRARDELYISGHGDMLAAM